jgi:hypothetical protein
MHNKFCKSVYRYPIQYIGDFSTIPVNSPISWAVVNRGIFGRGQPL